jgi:hypothetical protein
MFLIGCQERHVQYRSSHHLAAHQLNPKTIAHVYNWESKLASGRFLVRVTPQDFFDFHEAILNGVFDPDTALSDTQINQIGRNACTSAPTDATIGLRRFERTLTMAPEFLVMTDNEGRFLEDWLRALKRDDLLAIERSAQVKLALGFYLKRHMAIDLSYE